MRNEAAGLKGVGLDDRDASLKHTERDCEYSHNLCVR